MKADKKSAAGREKKNFTGKWRLLVLILPALFFLSCREEVSYENPFDPAVPILPPTNLRIAAFWSGFSGNGLELKWSENNVFTDESQKACVRYIVLDGTDSTAMDTLMIVDGTNGPYAWTYQAFSTDTTYYFRVIEKLDERLAGQTNIVSGRPTPS